MLPYLCAFRQSGGKECLRSVFVRSLHAQFVLLRALLFKLLGESQLHQLLVLDSGHGPTDDSPREQIEYRSQVQPPLLRIDKDHVSDPLPVGGWSLKVACQEIGGKVSRCITVGGHDTTTGTTC